MDSDSDNDFDRTFLFVAAPETVGGDPDAGSPMPTESEQFAAAEMVCQVENLFQDGEWAIMEWSDPLGLRGCGFFRVVDGRIAFQRGYWDKLSFLRMHGLPVPRDAP